MVLGASGNIGTPILRALMAEEFIVSALTRQSSNATFPDSVKIVKSDYTHGSLVQVFKGQDAIVSALSNFATDEQIRIIDAAIEAGVKRFLPSEYGIDSSDPQFGELLPPGKPKPATVAYLREKEGSISWTGVLAGSFFDWALQLGLLGWNVRDRAATIFDGGDIPYEATNIAQIARAVAAVLTPKNYDQTSNQYVFINSFTVTQSQVLVKLEEVTGTKFNVTNVKAAEVFKEGHAQLATGIVETLGNSKYQKGSLPLIEAEIYNLHGMNRYSQTKGLWNDRLGLPQESLEETIKGVVKVVS